MITAAQRRFYHAAAGAACRYLGIVGSDAQRAYRHQILQEEVGISDLHQLSQDDLDRVIFRFWLDAADYQAAANVSGNNARRTAYLANDCASQIASIVGLKMVSH